MEPENARKLGLQIMTCTSRMEKVQTENHDMAVVEQLIAEKLTGDAVLVVWQLNAVLFGYWSEGKLTMAPDAAPLPDLWQELRIFNEDAELHLRRCGGGFSGRFRQDTAIGNGTDEYVDSYSRFWGEAVAYKDGFVTLRDTGRKISLAIPAAEGGRWYGLTTRHYIGYDEGDTRRAGTGLAGYMDYRFVRVDSTEEGR